MKIFIYVFLLCIVLCSCATIKNTCLFKVSPGTFRIMGSGEMPIATLSLFLLKHNPRLNLFYAIRLARLYNEESSVEGVNADVAFAQMCLETGYLKFGGTVTPDQNNFCGLGTVSKDVPGEIFETMREGIRAHVQHLKAYGSTSDLVNPLIDNRFKWVERGIAPTVFDLSGRWAADLKYGDNLRSILERLYEFSGTTCAIQFPHLAYSRHSQY
ncbi:MAG: glucosaminidase domain-containing protein [Spirochaetales bacterium]|nr:glucosaminidase domain-containing protein [Spirochaetales bacterium]